MSSRPALVAGVLDSLTELLRAMHTCVDGKGQPAKKAGKAELTRSQVGAMWMLRRNRGALAIKELAEKLCVSSPAATQIVEGLVRGKYAVRSEDPRDRRRTAVVLTEKGRKRLEEAKKKRHAAFLALVAPLTDAELQQWHAIQRKILSAAQPHA